MRASRVLSAAVAALALVGGSELGGAVLTPLGVEFQVNTYTIGIQRPAAAAMDNQGRFVVVWESTDNQDGDATGIFGRRFDAAGNSLAAEFQVNVHTPSTQINPVVAMSPGGGFVVVWESFQDGSGTGIFGRRFDQAGTGVGVEFQVNTYTTGSQGASTVGIDGDGDFVVAWMDPGKDGSSGGVFAQRFAASGAVVGVEFQVNNYITSLQNDPAVGMNGDGAFVVAWESFQDGDESGIFARRFNAVGVGYGEFKVNVHTNSTQSNPAVRVSGDGRFVVVWQSFGQDGQDSGIFGRRFISAGGALSGDFQINILTVNAQSYPSLGIETDGDFFVAWEDGDGAEQGVFVRRFASTGNAVSDPIQVNSYFTGAQREPAIANRDHGDFVVAWDGEYQDGSITGVFARRLRSLVALDVDGDGSTDPLTDGLLTLRFEFGFTGAVLTSGAVDVANCSRCTATAIEEYLNGQNR